MGMGPQNQIRPIVRKKQCPILLLLCCLQRILRSPMRTYHHEIRQLSSLIQILCHTVPLQHIHRIGHICRQRNAVGSISIIQHRDPDSILFIYIDFLLPLLAVMNPQHRHPGIALFPKGKTVQYPLFALVQSVIGSMQYHIESRIRQSVPQFIRGIKSRIA